MNPTAQALISRAIEGATGALDWSDDKRRRVVYLDGGEVALAMSNLKSESAERIGAAAPGLAGETLLAAVGAARLRGLLAERGGDATWNAGQVAPRREPVELAAALYQLELPRPSITTYLRAQGSGLAWLRRQRLPGGLASYVSELDGTRTFDEVLSFAPCEPDVADRWIRVAVALGLLVDSGIESSVYEVRAVTKRRAWAGGVDDIASMIADATGNAAPAGTQAAAQPTPLAVAAPPTTAAGRMAAVHARIEAATDHFGVLGVSWQDPPETLRRAYFTLARELHPDRFVGEPAEVRDTANLVFDKLRAAWEVLADDSKREAYIARVVRGEKSEDELAMEKVRAILDAEADFKRALADFYAGRLAQAHELFVRCAQAVPEEPEFAAHAAYTTFKVHHGRDTTRADEALARLKEVVAANERLDSGLVLLGLAHRTRGDEKAAREAFVAALKVKPSNPDAVRELKKQEKQREAKQDEDEATFLSRLFGKRK